MISLQGLSLKMKIDFTVTILRFFSYGPENRARYQDFAPKMGKYGHLDPLLMSVAPETFPKCSPDYEFIHKFQELSLKMKMDFTVSV